MKNKQLKITLLLVGACITLASCGQKAEETKTTETVTQTTEQAVQQSTEEEMTSGGISYVDALENTITLSETEVEQIRKGDSKVAVLNGSFAEIWTIAGGKLAAVTADAYDEGRTITLDESVKNVGELKSPSVEMLVEDNHKFAILSSDIEEHVSLKGKLEEVGITPIYFSIETFDDYKNVLKFCTDLTGDTKAYETYGSKVEEQIKEAIAKQDGTQPTVLFIRAFSTGAKAKGSDNMTGIMLKDLGCSNIADGENQLLDDLSMEVILEKDPDYIFVTTMGSDEQAALDSVQTLLKDNPAWSSLSAVKKEQYHVLPKNMFHNKPNQRWGESYQMLADILYGKGSAE